MRTDLLTWDRPAFGEPADSLIKDIYRLGGHKLLEDDVLGRKLWKLWPLWGGVDDAQLSRLADELARLRDQLHQQAIDSGWDVD